MVRPMVHSTKHYVQTSLATILGGAKSDVVLIDAVAVGNKNLVSEVEEGSSVKAIYIEEWLRAGDTVGGSFIACLYKAPGGLTPFGTIDLAALGNAENKKNILYSSQGLVNDQDADALSVARGWFKIPKSKQRFGLGDRLIWAIFAQGTIDLHRCGLAIYKEYS